MNWPNGLVAYYQVQTLTHSRFLLTQRVVQMIGHYHFLGVQTCLLMLHYLGFISVGIRGTSDLPMGI